MRAMPTRERPPDPGRESAPVARGAGGTGSALQAHCTPAPAVLAEEINLRRALVKLAAWLELLFRWGRA